MREEEEGDLLLLLWSTLLWTVDSLLAAATEAAAAVRDWSRLATVIGWMEDWDDGGEEDAEELKENKELEEEATGNGDADSEEDGVGGW